MDLGVYKAVGGSSVLYGEPATASGYVAVPSDAPQTSDNLAAAIFISGGGQSDLSHENEPTLYIEPNRTSAIDDIRSVVIYIFIITIFFSFFLILPGIRNEKFPTFLCITTSLVVTSIVLIALLGTTWHVAEAPISAAYKAFSRDRIQGDLEVRIGLQSVNISLVAHKYYLLQAGEGVETLSDSSTTAFTAAPIDVAQGQHSANRTSVSWRRPQRNLTQAQAPTRAGRSKARRSIVSGQPASSHAGRATHPQHPSHMIRKSKIDINYNERFHWIEPNQMSQEYQAALKRGLPYPILTVVEYLSQDEAGFSWSRQYRAAGYYTAINLWLSLCLCVLMFSLHCAAPRYGIYSMQLLGCLLLFTNLTFATLVPRGERELVIPFEGQSLTFRFGWNFWLVLVGGCLSLLVGTIIVIIDNLFPNFIFTTVLDADFDSQHCHKKDRVFSRPAPRAEPNSPASGKQQQQQRERAAPVDGVELPISGPPTRFSQRHTDRRRRRGRPTDVGLARWTGASPAETGKLYRRRDEVALPTRRAGADLEEG